MKNVLLLFVVVVLSSNCAVQGVEDTHNYASAVQATPPSSSEYSLADLPKLRVVDQLGDNNVKHFSTYAQCQIQFDLSSNSETGLSIAQPGVLNKLDACLEAAIDEEADVLIFPELSLAVGESERIPFINKLKAIALEEQMIIIAGSYYDEGRQNRIPVIGPGWEEYGYKIRPSRFEVSPRSGHGMEAGEELLLIKTPFGRIMPLTCVDLISDGAQYVVRHLSNQGQLDVLANINYNPAAWEFLIEANSITRRHPVFVSITNVSSFTPTYGECEEQGDDGYCAGNSAVFASLRTRSSDCPNCFESIAEFIEPQFMQNNERHLAYDRLVAAVPALKEGMLIYDLNLRLVREPLTTNAPDQGYPPIRNLRRIEF